MVFFEDNNGNIHTHLLTETAETTAKYNSNNEMTGYFQTNHKGITENVVTDFLNHVSGNAYAHNVENVTVIIL